VSGVVLTVHRGGSPEPLNLTQVQFRPGVPLQATLYALAQAAAHSLASQGIGLQELASLTAGVTLLADPALHGTVADPDLNGVNSRAVLVMERGRAGLVFDPSQSPKELLREAAKQAQVHTPAAASVFSLE